MRYFLGCILAIGLLSLSGCGFGNPVTGKIVQDGKPITGANSGDTITLQLVQTDGTKKSFPAAVDHTDWSFKMLSRLPSGNYVAKLSWIEDYTKFREKNPKGDMSAIPDKFKDAFMTDKSPLTGEISGESTLTIDVGTKKITK